MLYFGWDPHKAAENLAKHRISFGAASTALEDTYAVDWEDQFVEGELRHSMTGMAHGHAIVTICYTLEPIGEDGDDLAWIISARKATSAEREEYEQDRAKDSRHSPE